jgi:hypothetical protein
MLDEPDLMIPAGENAKAEGTCFGPNPVRPLRSPESGPSPRGGHGRRGQPTLVFRPGPATDQEPGTVRRDDPKLALDEANHCHMQMFSRGWKC